MVHFVGKGGAKINDSYMLMIWKREQKEFICLSWGGEF